MKSVYGPMTRVKWQRRQSYLRNIEKVKEAALEAKRRTQRWFKKEKLERCEDGCPYCGLKGPAKYFDFHHRDPSTKITTVSDMVGRFSRDTILVEMNKCDLICKECHKKQHSKYPFHCHKRGGIPV